MSNITNIVGDFFEYATVVISGGVLLPTRTTDLYCPDVLVNERHYIESKAIGRSAKLILYESRVIRQTQWALERNAQVDYYIWKYCRKVGHWSSKQRIRKELREYCKELLIIPQQLIFSLIDSPAKVINRGNYPSMQKGWFIPYSRLKGLVSLVDQKEIPLRSHTMLVKVFRADTPQ